MKEKEAEAYLDSLSVGAILHPGKEEMHLEALRELLARMGNPEKELRYVHIAGTNGKGSVLAYVSTVLQESGYRAGRYFSPALRGSREKIQVGGRSISAAAFREGLGIIAECTGRMAEEGRTVPTLFEVETALAFWYFRKKRCDIVVLECGLGGRTDATNVIPAPEVCVFTPVTLDHMDILGKTAEEIAAVKAGIIKPGAAVVSAPQSEGVWRVLRQAAGTAGAEVVFAPAPEHARYGMQKQTFDALGYRKLEIGLAGIWQPENAALAVTVLDELGRRGWKIPEAGLRGGLLKTRWSGRFTVLRERPYLILDGAHNAAAAAALRESLDLYLPGRSFVMILGVLRDKAYGELLRCLMPLAVQVIVLTPPDNPRALSGLELAEEVRSFGVSVTGADSVEEALELAELLSGKKFPILATGSLSWLGRMEDAVRAKTKKRS